MDTANVEANLAVRSPNAVQLLAANISESDNKAAALLRLASTPTDLTACSFGTISILPNYVFAYEMPHYEVASYRKAEAIADKLMRAVAGVTLAVPVIIPPTYFKALSNLYLREIWHTAEQSLQDCRNLVFCGYSFPDADVHVRYLLKRTELHRKSPIDVYVVNEHDGKTEDARRAEKSRYTRFFREDSRVRWKEMSFEQFCQDPSRMEEPAA